MALQRQSATINFRLGLDTKSDPFQINIGNFLNLTNSVFGKTGGMVKRNGFGSLPSLPDSSSSFLTTFNNNLTAIGSNLYALNAGGAKWYNFGNYPACNLSVLPLVRNNNNQSYVDTALSSNGLVCAVFNENVPTSSTTTSFAKYAILDATTGQSIVRPTNIFSSFGTVSFSPKVWSLGNYFIIVYGTFNGSVYHLQYSSIPINNVNTVSSSIDISTNYAPNSRGAFDAALANNALYISWNSVGSQGVKTTYLNQFLGLVTPVTYNSVSANIINVSTDLSGNSPIIWNTVYNQTSSSGNTWALNSNLASIASASIYTNSSSGLITNLTSTVYKNVNQIFYEVNNIYSYGSITSSNLIKTISVGINGSLSQTSVVNRSVGLSSKAFLIGTSSYFLSAYQSSYQPTYFLEKLNPIDKTGLIVSRFAYGNGGGYSFSGLPDVTASGNSVSIGYLFKDLVAAVNKDTNVPSGTQINGIYSQTGINLIKFNFNTSLLSTAETAGTLNMNGGFLWSYDGTLFAEQNFFLYPDNVNVVSSGNGGFLSAQTYFYQALYRWTDNQGNINRSAPSIPITVVLASGTSINTIQIPTLRLTYKTINPICIEIYRWSTAQQVYYQITSIATPLVNDPSVDSLSFTDTLSDSTILGNNLLYTTGGVVEDVGAPSFNALTLFDNREWGIDAEDPNKLWYSKTVIENTPVEMSDLFTLFVPPTTSTQLSTGPMKCLAPMDDKLIIFKRNAIYYINGTGPDNTGANSQYSQPVLITSTVGCENQNSIVFMPNGLMFQSDKGIWLLGRDLSTNYIGAAVERYNSAFVESALTIPETNEIRFTLDNGITLLYDYYYQQWGTFSGIPGISSTLYNNLHTYIDSFGRVFQETPGLYLDGSNPVLMSFTTGWLNLTGLQGFQKIYELYLLGNYSTPHTLTCGVAYDYNPNITQLPQIYPNNFSQNWGVSSTWGSQSLWGGLTQREQWQVNFERMECQSFQISFNEYYDSRFGVAAGAGLEISAINLVYGSIKGWPGNIPASQRVT